MRTNHLCAGAIAAAALIATQTALAQREPSPIDPSTGTGVQRESGSKIGTPPYNPQSETRTTQKQTNAASAEFARVSELIGSNVQGEDGKKIGKIEEVMLDGTGRTLQFAVMGKGGFFGIGEQLLPVPWQSLQAQEGQPGYLLKIDDQKLGSAPKLQSGRYEDFDRAEFKSEVYKFYGVQPEGVGAPSPNSDLQKGQSEAQEPQGTGQLPGEHHKDLK